MLTHIRSTVNGSSPSHFASSLERHLPSEFLIDVNRHWFTLMSGENWMTPVCRFRVTSLTHSIFKQFQGLEDLEDSSLLAFSYKSHFDNDLKFNPVAHVLLVPATGAVIWHAVNDVSKFDIDVISPKHEPSYYLNDLSAWHDGKEFVEFLTSQTA